MGWKFLVLETILDDLQGMKIQSYDDQLLHLSVDLAQRMLPAFDTPTGSLLLH